MTKFQFTDPTDNLAGPNYREEKSQSPSGVTIHFRHIPTGLTCEFKAFITDFDDNFESEWEGTDVYGRMDDIQTYKKTKRKINLSWTVPSHSQEEAISNFNEISKMTSMQYPVYEDLENGPQGGNFQNNPDLFLDVEKIQQNLLQVTSNDPNVLGAIQGSLEKIKSTILSAKQDNSLVPIVNQQVSLLSSPPIFQLKFMNWASSDNDEGLFGTMSDFKFKPSLDDGVFIRDGLLIPMTTECSVNFTVIHTDKLGWDRSKNKRTTLFPYHITKNFGV